MRKEQNFQDLNLWQEKAKLTKLKLEHKFTIGKDLENMTEEHKLEKYALVNKQTKIIQIKFNLSFSSLQL